MSQDNVFRKIGYHKPCPMSRQRSGIMARIIEGNEMNLIGDKVKELRIAKGMSQQTLSDRLEMLAIYICRGSISRIEDKQRTVTDIELYGIAKVLGVPIEALFKLRDIDLE